MIVRYNIKENQTIIVIRKIVYVENGDPIMSFVESAIPLIT